MAEKEKTIVAVDAMGGDFAPEEPVKGAIMAIEANPNLIVTLVGAEDKIKEELGKYNYEKDRIRILPTTEVIDTEEPPVKAIQSKKDSSMVKAMMLLRKDEADALVSCGNTGALLVGGQVLVGRVKGVERAALAFLLPTLTSSPTLLTDVGANVDCKASNLVQFGKMGNIYMRDIIGIKEPRVGILNIGEEEEKGNRLVKETFPLMRECTDLNFIGSVESRGILAGDADVIVADGFDGNLVLKMCEGVSAALLSEIKKSLMSSLKTKIGAALVKSSLKETLKKFSVEEYGGAPLLGIKKVVMKSHGNSKAVEIKNTILQCVSCVNEDMVGKIAASI